MKFIFSILLLFNLSFADIITSPAFMYVPGNIYHNMMFSDDSENHSDCKNKECNSHCVKADQELSVNDRIVLMFFTCLCIIIVVLICLEV